MSPQPPKSLDEFMAQAYAMELEAQQRYEDLADAMEMHNNREVADLFRKMAVIEGKHAAQIMAEMGWKQPPPFAAAPAWQGFESAESVSIDDVHYLMRPWHALQLALAAEKRAESFFSELAMSAQAEPIRKAAIEMRDEEREHVELVEAWLAKVPQPEQDWAIDPDPPRYDQ
jgi:rubrerythrin